MGLHRYQGGESYRVELVALGDDGAPPVIRLRHLLKHALRQLRLKCVSAVETTPYPDGRPGGESPANAIVCDVEGMPDELPS
jgi:hypothetical protein